VSQVTDAILGLHGAAALAVVFILPALEASAFVGFVFPGEIAVLLGGVLAAEHRVGLPAVIAVAILGAVAGDTAGYWIGRRFGRRLLELTVGRVVKREHLERGEAYLVRRGGRAVFIGRFTAALRVLIPGLAGMSGLHFPTFALWNVLGGIVWATGFVLLGFAAGESWRKVEHVAKRASLLLLVLVVVLGGGALLARWVARHQERVRRAAARVLDRPLLRGLVTVHRRVLGFIGARLRPGEALGLELTLGLLTIGVAGWAFGVVLSNVVSHQALVNVDQPVQRFFLAHREHWLNTAMKALTNLGSSFFLLPVILVVGVARWVRTGRRRPLVLLAGAYLGSIVLYDTVKVLVGRPRPPVGQMVSSFSGYAFPSGHATQAVAVYGMLAALVAVRTGSWTAKVAAWACAVGIWALVGFSRLYLGVHWLTDVLGGFALGGLWLFALLLLARTVPALRGPRAGRARPAPRPTG
jgi:membrane protein DedA with SNARE-associated domain